MLPAVNALGQEMLTAVHPATAEITAWKTFLENYRPAPDLFGDDAYIWLTCVLALKAISSGNFGVGSVLADARGQVVAYGHNQMFAPYFRSDLHAEMVTMNVFEDRCRDCLDLIGYRLYSSLEPCPMCTVRLISSRVAAIKYAAADLRGGMARQMKQLPEFWADLGSGKNFTQAACSEVLENAAQQILMLNLDELAAKL
jgi:tRNA(Arg) A34 adenosine deaminase TadA